MRRAADYYHKFQFLRLSIRCPTSVLEGSVCSNGYQAAFWCLRWLPGATTT